MSSDLDYRAIRKRVDAGLTQQKFRRRMGLFVAQLFMYIVFMIIAWGIFLSSGGVAASNALATAKSDSPLIGSMIMLSMAGFAGLMFQAASIAMDTKRGENRIREQLMTQEINREMLKMGLDDVEEHEKRKGMMRLSDDGELEEIADEPVVTDEEASLKRQR